MGLNRDIRLKKYRLVFLWVIGLFILWQVLISDTVGNAILAFCFDGVVPGTRVVLAPNTVLLGVAVLFGLACILPLLRWMLHLSTGQRHDIVAPVLADRYTTHGTLAATPLIKQHKQRQPLRSRLVWFEQFTSLILPVQRWLKRQNNSAVRVLATMARSSWLRVQRLYAWALRVVARSTASLRAASIKAWRWIAPYLWRFDAWLEMQVRTSGAWLDKYIRDHEIIGVLVDAVRKGGLRSVGKSRTKTTLAQIAHQLKTKISQLRRHS